MAKKIKHPYSLDLQYQVVEDGDFEELERIQVKVFESKDDEHDETLSDNYLEIHITRIINVHDNDLQDIADSDSQELLDAITPIVKDEHDEFMGQALKIDSTIFLSQYIYIENIKLHGDFSELSLPAALSKTLKTITKGNDAQEWVAMIYEKNTFFQGDENIKQSTVKECLKDLGFFALPKVVTHLDKAENVISIVGGETLVKKLEYAPELLQKKNKKMKA